MTRGGRVLAILIDVPSILGGIINYFITIFKTLWQSSTGQCCLAIIGFMGLFALFARIGPYLRGPSKTYGTARFGDGADIMSLIPRAGEKHNRLRLGTHMSLLRPSMSLSDKQQESHVFICAPSGKGKTASIIIPGLLREDGHKSLFINDIKRELINRCLGTLQTKGYTCYVLSPTRPQESHRYNPLCHVSSMEDAEDLAACIVDNTGTSVEPFWNNSAKLLLTATILHLRASNPKAPLSEVTEILCGNIEDIMQIIMKSPSRLARNAASSFLSSFPQNPKLAGSVLADMATRLLGLQNPNMVSVTSEDEIDFEEFIDQPTALILSIPASDSRRLRWFSAAFSMQLMSYVTKKAEESPDGRLPRPLAFYLDEFSNMGVIPHFLQHISLVRSAGIAFILAIQNFSQLQNTYGSEGLDTVLAGSATHVVFSGCGQRETEFYSRRMGVHTVRPQAESFKGWNRTDETTTQSEAGRPLMFPDELRTMKADQLIVLSENLPPVRVKMRPYFKQQRLKKRVNLPMVLPYRPIDLEAMDRVIITEVQ